MLAHFVCCSRGIRRKVKEKQDGAHLQTLYIKSDASMANKRIFESIEKFEEEARFIFRIHTFDCAYNRPPGTGAFHWESESSSRDLRLHDPPFFRRVLDIKTIVDKASIAIAELVHK